MNLYIPFKIKSHQNYTFTSKRKHRQREKLYQKFVFSQENNFKKYKVSQLANNDISLDKYFNKLDSALENNTY